jgi:hypothetical protein
MDLRFVNHPGFHRAAASMVAAGAGFSAIAHPLAARLHVAPSLIGGSLAIALGAGWAYGSLRRRALIGLVACVPVALSATWGALLAMAGLTALALVGGIEGRRRAALGWALGAGAVTLAGLAGLRIFYAQETVGWAPLLRSAVAGGAMGLLGAVATLPRHLFWDFDAVLTATRKLPTTVDREVAQLCDRSVAIWRAAKSRLAADPTSQELLRSGVLKVLEVATRTAEGGDGMEVGAERDLTTRIADLDQRIAAASDAETKAQYVSAREGLDDQRKYRDRLRAGRERMVARLHNHVAALEKFHLAAVSLEASKKLSVDEPLVKQLAELSSDVSASGEALADVAQ